MDFFKSVFSDDQHEQQADDDYLYPNPNQNPNQISDGAWSFGGLIKTIATKSEFVIQNYRRDLEEFGSELKKETAVIREVASRAVRGLPASLEVGASVAQESLESVGQAIDDIGSSVWKSTAGIISHGKDTIRTVDFDSDSSDSNISIARLSSSKNLYLKRYSRFDAQVRALQCDENTYLDEPDDLETYNEWKSGFELDLKEEKIDSLIKENGVVDKIYVKVVPDRINRESFWSRYFYKLHKLKQVEDARAKLVKRTISADEDEDLSWDFDDEEEGNDGYVFKDSSSGISELKESSAEVDTDSGIGENVGIGEKDLKVQSDETSVACESETDNGGHSEAKYDDKATSEGSNDESCKDSDISIVSSQPSMPEEEDLGWDEIEDIGSNDESKGYGVGITNSVDLRKRLSVVEQDEEDFSWDFEDDDDESVKS
ncbi:BSD domain-containing protein 1-like [Quillaja saponaria]|uniref:BSD domain-containing protein 1-like n=1 Tax=Quillaja saponaria TaxID=32244 RepID=A0AAD7QG01_QUISA|nr:BSD domain-containing protein 1-like [Quillaja saponaria]KAJ7980162.1 BSD domain-containing protein 1-like [Quillaja saponaria]